MLEKIAVVTPGAFYRYVITPTGQHFFSSLGQRIEKMIGVSKDELLKQADLLFERITEEDNKRVQQLIEKSALELSDFHAVFKLATDEQAEVWLEARSKPEKKENGDIVWTGFVYDVTEREVASNSLNNYLRNVDHIMDNMLDAVIATDATGKILFVNQATHKLLSYKRNDLVGQNIKCLMPAHHKSRHDQYMHDYRVTRRANIIGSTRSVEVISKQGERIPVELRICEYYKGSEQRFLGTLRDLRESIASISEIESLRSTDSLTGLCNRASLLTAINEALNQAKQDSDNVWLLCFDIDDFRLINEGFSIEYGDDLLIEIAKRLRQFCSKALCIARIHEDEFGILLNNLSNHNEISQFFEQLKSELEKPFQKEKFISSVRFSAGVSQLLPSEMNASDTLHCSEVALGNAKTANRGKLCIYEPTLSESYRSSAIIDQKLKSPRLLDDLFLVFQTQMKTDGTILGYEALIRWCSDGTMVRPDLFIPIAERNGTIIAIGDWLIDQACKFLAFQRKQSIEQPRRLSINISPVQFQQHNFVESIKNALRKYEVSPTNLHLELTERLLIESTEHITEKMSALSSLGITFSLDDFGTGYSSLSYLSQLPLTELKIDKSFVRDLNKGNRNYQIVEAIINLSHSLGLNVIAEGVETESELTALKTLGCTCFQGYYFAKPVTQEFI